MDAENVKDQKEGVGKMNKLITDHCKGLLDMFGSRVSVTVATMIEIDHCGITSAASCNLIETFFRKNRPGWTVKHFRRNSLDKKSRMNKGNRHSREGKSTRSSSHVFPRRCSHGPQREVCNGSSGQKFDVTRKH